MSTYYKVRYTDNGLGIHTQFLKAEDIKLDATKSSKPLEYCYSNDIDWNTETVTSVELQSVTIPTGTFGTDIEYIGLICAHKESGLATVIICGEQRKPTLELLSIYFLIEVLDNQDLVYSLVRLISDTDYHKAYMDLLLWQENQRFMGAGETCNINVGAPLVKDGVLLWIVCSKLIRGSVLTIDLAGVRFFARGSLYFVNEGKNDTGISNLLISLREDLEAVSIPIISSFEVLNIYLVPKGVALATLKSILSNVGYISKIRITIKLVLTPMFYDCIGGLYLELPFTQQLFKVLVKQVWLLDDMDNYAMAEYTMNLQIEKCIYQVEFTDSDIILRVRSGEQLKCSLQVSKLVDWLNNSSSLPEKTELPKYTVLKSYNFETILNLFQAQEVGKSVRPCNALSEIMGILRWLHNNGVQLALNERIKGGEDYEINN